MTKNQTTKHLCGATVIDAHDQIHHVRDLARPDILRGGTPTTRFITWGTSPYQILYVGEPSRPESSRGDSHHQSHHVGDPRTRFMTWRTSPDQIHHVGEPLRPESSDSRGSARNLEFPDRPNGSARIAPKRDSFTEY
jgi:hypothetical protein